MDHGGNKTPMEVIKEVNFKVLIFQTFILVFMESGTKSHGKNLIS